MEKTYLDGLREALALALAKPTAYAFSVAAQIQARIDAVQVVQASPLATSHPTAAEIEAAKTPRGAWTRATLAGWGVPWPPPKGWRKRLEQMNG